MVVGASRVVEAALVATPSSYTVDDFLRWKVEFRMKPGAHQIILVLVVALLLLLLVLLTLLLE